MTSKEITIYTTSNLKNDEYIEIKKDWFGEKAKYQCFYKLGFKDELISFKFKCLKNPYYEKLTKGTFKENLSDMDVSEIFIMNPQNKTYQEFNISPAGAWWSALFKGYRERKKEVKFDPEIVENTYGDNYWEINFCFLEKDLLLGIDFTKCKLNVASILYDESPYYFSHGWNEGGKPDFHHEKNFCELKFEYE